MKRLLIRADDLGFSDAVNCGIERTVRAGLVRSVGLMPNMPWAEDGVRKMNGLNAVIGQHTNICVGKPLCDPQDIPSLVNEKGEFKASSEYREAYEKGIDLVDLDEACREVEAQYLRFRKIVGKDPAYFEAHAIASDNLWKAVAMIAEKYDLPLCDMRPGQMTGTFNGKPVAPCTMRSMRSCYDPYHDLQEAVINGSDDLVNIVVCHPGYLDDYILNHSSLTVNRTREVAMLCDPDTEKWLNDHEVELVNYNDIK